MHRPALRPQPGSDKAVISSLPTKTQYLNKIQNLMISKKVRFQVNLSHHIKNQEDLKLDEKRQLIDANTKRTQMFELSNSLKQTSQKCCNEQLETCLKQMEKMKSLSK